MSPSNVSGWILVVKQHGTVFGESTKCLQWWFEENFEATKVSNWGKGRKWERHFILVPTIYPRFPCPNKHRYRLRTPIASVVLPLMFSWTTYSPSYQANNMIWTLNHNILAAVFPYGKSLPGSNFQSPDPNHSWRQTFFSTSASAVLFSLPTPTLSLTAHSHSWRCMFLSSSSSLNGSSLVPRYTVSRKFSDFPWCTSHFFLWSSYCFLRTTSRHHLFLHCTGLFSLLTSLMNLTFLMKTQ